MWLTFLTISVILHGGNCQNYTTLLQEIHHLTTPEDNSQTCIVNVIQKYFTEEKIIAYVNNLDHDADKILIRVHATKSVAVNIRIPPAKVSRRNAAYVIMAQNFQQFTKHMAFLNKEANWNPYGRFLVLFKSLEKKMMRQVFDVFLDLHVNNAVISVGFTTELFTYNPWDNFACGKYYTKIIELGKCSEVTEDIYPEKVKTGLRKCLFNVSVAHWPPYGIDPTRLSDGTVGSEQYIFDLISKIMGFNYTYNFDYNPELFSLVSSNMTVSGPMLLLAQNQTDVMIGGLMLIPSRASMFFYVHGHYDNIDEIRLIVKKAMEIPAWKNFYLEFSPLVWASLFFAMLIYSVLVMILTRNKDKGYILLIMLDNMLSHGSKIRSRQSVQCVFILWVWFTFLLNCFYTTTLMSLTTKPSLAYQISDEENIRSHGLKPCLSSVMNRFRKSETINGEILQDVDTDIDGCDTFLDSIKSVSASDRLFSIVLYTVYMYNRQQFYDEYGRSQIYSFTKPYAKVIYGMYFSKGFPMFERLHSLALRVRESGLANKNIRDVSYNQTRRYKFRSLGFVTRFTIPWYLYFVGVFISCITFVVEIVAQQKTFITRFGNEMNH